MQRLARLWTTAQRYLAQAERRGNSKTKQMRRPHRVQLEQLETLCLPSTITFSDGAFSSTYWGDAVVLDTTNDPPFAQYTASRVLTGGNPQSWRHITHSYGAGAIGVGHFRWGFDYDPSVGGAVTNLDYSFDLQRVNPPPGSAVRFRLLVQQGNYYFASQTFNDIFVAAWTAASHTALTQTSFDCLTDLATTPCTIFDPPNPDFSSTGSALQFGFVSLNSHSTPGQIAFMESGLDNYRVTLTLDKSEGSGPRPDGSEDAARLYVSSLESRSAGEDSLFSSALVPLPNRLTTATPLPFGERESRQPGSSDTRTVLTRAARLSESVPAATDQDEPHARALEDVFSDWQRAR